MSRTTGQFILTPEPPHGNDPSDLSHEQPESFTLNSAAVTAITRRRALRQRTFRAPGGNAGRPAA